MGSPHGAPSSSAPRPARSPVPRCGRACRAATCSPARRTGRCRAEGAAAGAAASAPARRPPSRRPAAHGPPAGGPGSRTLARAARRPLAARPWSLAAVAAARRLGEHRRSSPTGIGGLVPDAWPAAPLLDLRRAPGRRAPRRVRPRRTTSRRCPRRWPRPAPSPASSAPCVIDGEPHIDGGVHSPTNADVAAGRRRRSTSCWSARRCRGRVAGPGWLADQAMRTWSGALLDAEARPAPSPRHAWSPSSRTTRCSPRWASTPWTPVDGRRPPSRAGHRHSCAWPSRGSPTGWLGSAPEQALVSGALDRAPVSALVRRRWRSRRSRVTGASPDVMSATLAPSLLDQTGGGLLRIGDDLAGPLEGHRQHLVEVVSHGIRGRPGLQVLAGRARDGGDRVLRHAGTSGTPQCSPRLGRSPRGAPSGAPWRRAGSATGPGSSPRAGRGPPLVTRAPAGRRRRCRRSPRSGTSDRTRRSRPRSCRPTAPGCRRYQASPTRFFRLGIASLPPQPCRPDDPYRRPRSASRPAAWRAQVPGPPP